MATQSLDIVIKVKDAASDKLDKTGKKLKDLGNKAKQTDVDFVKFNRTLFTTTAFIATFHRAFSSMFESIGEGAEVDRLSTQFERVLGPKGQLFTYIKEFTDNSIDRFEAMRAGLELKSLGIVSNIRQVAELTSRAGTAAKLAGKQSAEGIQEFSAFLKDGAVSHLEFLNLIAKTNPALMAQLAILKSSGKVLGGVIEKQFILGVGQKLLKAATEGQMKGNRDLEDSVLDLKQAYFFLRAEIGTFIGRALAPLLDKISDAMDSFSGYLENLRKTDKNVMFLTKSSLVLGIAITGVAAAVGTLRLSLMLLSSVGLGLPRIIMLGAALATTFFGITASVEGLENKFRIFAAFFTGTWQLISSFLEDPENFAKGIGKIDKSIADLLRKNGLLTLATNIARISSTIYLFVRDAGKQLVDWGKELGSVINKLLKLQASLFGIDTGPWSRGLIDGGNKIRSHFIKIAAAILPLFLGFKALKSVFGGLLGRIPVIGGLFGGGGFGAKGTPTNPMYVKDVGGLFGGIAKGFIGTEIAGALTSVLGPAALGAAVAGLGYTLAETINTKASGPISNTIQGLMSKISQTFGGTGIISDEDAFSEGEKRFKSRNTALIPGATGKTEASIPSSDQQTDALDNLFNQIKQIGDASQRKQAETMAESGLMNYKKDAPGKDNQEKLLNMIAVLLSNIDKNTKNNSSNSVPPRRNF